jgi:hypothetical protein
MQPLSSNYIIYQYYCAYRTLLKQNQGLRFGNRRKHV